MMLSIKQIKMMLHALGLPNKLNKPYRNYYCVDVESPDHYLWKDIESKRMAVMVANQGEWSGDIFKLTDLGKQHVLDTAQD